MAEVYGEYPGQFDTTVFTVQSVADLVNSALESANALIGGAEGSEPVPCYSIGYESGDAGINGAKSVVYLDSCGWETQFDTTVWSYANGVEAIKSSPYNDSLHVWTTFTEAPDEPVDEPVDCRAELSECLDIANATRETCIEERDTRRARRTCRRDYRDAQVDCLADFGECLANSRSHPLLRRKTKGLYRRLNCPGPTGRGTVIRVCDIKLSNQIMIYISILSI